MNQRLNSATRFLRITEKALSHQGSENSIQSWAIVLGINSHSTLTKIFKVTELLVAMNRELENLREQAYETSLPRDAYMADLLSLETAISPQWLTEHWSRVIGCIKPEMLKSLNYLSVILPDEEAEISEGELSDISEQISVLKIMLEDASISKRLRKLIQHHISLIEKALAEYQIFGVKGLREVAHTALGEMIESKDEFESEKGSKVANILGELWSKVNKATDAALKFEKIGQLANKAWDYINWIN